ncbi:enoyl-CoA hydratase/isomerase family protein [Acidicapsa ligni]|uniref:enoyl-CoA hydratase/isomerase family protein n=1 Tax=Acidicapsa ligni TaxID=542300 RepID=UPI0021DFF581|nr:enoyl-CoA hydratase-related protein [Acidicapsa ligni]
MSHFQHILVESQKGVQTITLNRPEKRNALSPELIDELTQVFDDAANCDCGAVILTGAGSAFCAGLDMEHLETMNARTVDEHRRDSENMARVLRTLYEFPKPIIAAVNGPAIAGGMGLATLCDFTYATPDARFGYTEVRVGFVPAIVASFLTRQIGEKRTRELLLSGRIIKADEACRLGLVTRIVQPEELMPEACSLAQSLLQNSPEAMRAVKELLTSHSSNQIDEEIEEAIAANARQRSSEDFREGVRAFLEHRRPEWPSMHEKV